jgi:hypothetical protein
MLKRKMNNNIHKIYLAFGNVGIVRIFLKVYISKLGVLKNRRF